MLEITFKGASNSCRLAVAEVSEDDPGIFPGSALTLEHYKTVLINGVLRRSFNTAEGVYKLKRPKTNSKLP